MGRSGSGKSTALRCINGLEKINSGEITVCNHHLHHDVTRSQLRALHLDVGIVFQSYNLFPHLTVGQNIMLAPRWVQRLGRASGIGIKRARLDARRHQQAEGLQRGGAEHLGQQVMQRQPFVKGAARARPGPAVQRRQRHFDQVQAHARSPCQTMRVPPCRPETQLRVSGMSRRRARGWACPSSSHRARPARFSDCRGWWALSAVVQPGPAGPRACRACAR
ncbi:ATP-binding cassette domain-containing protein [Paracoccus aminovorans]|uniref:ATP-binding cassette domain-containing protein n=1 Tax=Paracoccus aminovorans TaxID=34004 RepID=UPI0020A4E9BA|nr:ATP-binding cassette domain-containing protein [Paracoccus aminovorans]MDQ7774407.1 ATP-binding cassette domain-containing protein [Paracoccus aminovorans]